MDFMNSMYVPIMIALAVVLLAWGAAKVVMLLADADSRRLKQRLNQEGRPQGEAESQGLVMRDQTGLSGQLARMRLFAGLHRKVLQAYPQMPLLKFLGICSLCGFVAFMLAAAFAPLGLTIPAALIGAYIPVLMVNTKRSSRQRAMTLQLPEALDFLCRILRAGHSFSTGLQMMGEELPEPLGPEFHRCHSQHSLGQPLESALKEMTTRIESSDFAFFVTAVMIQRQTGGDLTVLLNNISATVRQRIRIQQQMRSKTAEGRFSGYILVAFPVVMFAIMYAMNPDYIGVMLHDSTGQAMLAVAVGLQLAGLWSIRRITAVEV
jgi:tight adherence protein B